MTLISSLDRVFPTFIDIRQAYRLLSRRRSSIRECNCCGVRQPFRSYGVPSRLDAKCANCGSLERHRFLHLFLERHQSILKGADLLHFAPESATRSYVEPLLKSYKGCDLFPKGDEIKIDIENIELPDLSFSLIICCHVLEHVNDRKALAEMWRVLRPGGIVLLMFPIIEGWDTTYENPSIVSTQDRILHFGQEDHVRYFGRDVRDRIRNAGYKLTEYTAVEPDVNRYGLLRGQKIFVAQKPE